MLAIFITCLSDMSQGTLKFLGKPLLTWLPKNDVIKKVIVFLHGSGDTGDGVSQWLESLGVKEHLFEDTAIVFPSAPPRPYSMYGGEISTVWHDRYGVLSTI